MCLYKKFNISEETLDLDDAIGALELTLSEPVRALTSSYKSFAVSESYLIACWSYLLGEINIFTKYAPLVIKYTHEYLFGNWKETTPNDEKETGHEAWLRYCWFDKYREGVVWGSVMNQWEEIQEISKYPHVSSVRPRDYETAYYYVLACYIRGEKSSFYAKQHEQVETGKRKREKLLLAVLDTIICGDEKTFAKEFNKYLTYFKKYEYPKDTTEVLALDGTFLVNLAKHKGMQVQFPEKYIDHYIL